MKATKTPSEAKLVPRRRPSESDSRDLLPSTGVGSLVGNAGIGRILRSPTVVRRSGGTRLGLDESVARAIQQRRGWGASLSRGVRERMEGVFGQDFSDVRIHKDSTAHQLSERLQARAFTVGSDIFFARGSHGAASSDGKKLLAHELTHVVEQSGAGCGAPTSVSSPADDSERRADIVADHALTRLGRDKEPDGAARQVGNRGSPQAPTEVAASPAAARIADFDLGGPSTRRAVVARQLSAEQREQVEARTGPLVEPVVGAPLASVPDATRDRLRTDLFVNIEAWKNAAHTAITDFVRDHDSRAVYRHLVFAILAAPLTVVGATLSGPLAVTVAVAGAAVATLKDTPGGGPSIDAFRDKMRDAYDRVYENRVNSLDAILWNFLMSVPPERAANEQQLRIDLVARCFENTTGAALNVTRTRDAARRVLELRWREAEAAHRAAQLRAITDPTAGAWAVTGV